VVAKSETGYDDKSWVRVAPSLKSFVYGLHVDMRNVKSVLRLCGPANITPTFRAWLETALGKGWEAKVQAEAARGKRNVRNTRQT